MKSIRIKAQIYSGEEIAIGPGKVDLLQAIDAHGSISAAAREMGMSYRRAWLLVDVMNRCFRSPLVETDRGGSERGGARLTALGRKTLARYRDLQRGLDEAASPHLRAILRTMRTG
jgi:molybdate transport system regulatory protein